MQNISGYSKGGILEDCTIPYPAYPLENLNISLKDITARLLKEFGLNFIIDSSVVNETNLAYPKAVAGPEETVKEFISKLAAQREKINPRFNVD